jgi:hypothetical protein
MPFFRKHGAIVDGDTTLYLRQLQISGMHNDIRDLCPLHIAEQEHLAITRPRDTSL